MSFLGPIRSRATSTPDELSLVDCSGPLEALSYRELVQLAAAVAEYLSNANVSKGEHVSIRIQDKATFILAVLALEGLGVQTLDFTGANIPGRKVVSDSPQRTDEVVLDAQRLRLLASQQAVFREAVDPIETIIFLSEAPVRTGRLVPASTVAARMSGRAFGRQGGQHGGWLCAADMRSELGFSCVMQLLGAGQPVGLSSGSLQGDVQLADLYNLRSLYITSGVISSYAGVHNSGLPLRYLPRRVAVAGQAVEWKNIADTVGELATEILVEWDLPECGAAAVAKFHPADQTLRFSPTPDCALKLWSSDGEGVYGIGTRRIAVRSPTLALQASEAEHLHDGWFVSSVQGRRDGEHYVLLP